MNLYRKSIDILTKLPWYTEGPVVDDEENIFFTTLRGGKIMKLNKQGKLSSWAESPCPNGQLILRNDDHLVCDVTLKTVSRFNADGQFISHDIKEYCAGEKIYSPNDLTADKQGGVYFTDSIRNNGKVFYYDSDGRERVVARDLDFPNGIAISNDGKLIFVAESYRNRILVADTRSLKNNQLRWQLFAELPFHPSGDFVKNLPDGIKVDANDNLLVAHYGMQAVQVLSPDGQYLHGIKTEFPLTSNIFLQNNTIILTGGYGEPGPGGLLKMIIE